MFVLLMQIIKTKHYVLHMAQEGFYPYVIDKTYIVPTGRQNNDADVGPRPLTRTVVSTPAVARR